MSEGVCGSVGEYVRVCESVQECVRMCQSVLASVGELEIEVVSIWDRVCGIECVRV